MINFAKTSIPIPPRLKLALVPLLAAVFIIQLWPSRETPTETDTDEASDVAADASQSIAAADAKDHRKWPEVDLDATLRHNPFHSAITQPPPAERTVTPAVDAEDRAAAKSEVLRLENRRVSAVLISPQGPSAIIDSKFCRVNDWLEPGIRVAEIRPDGVVLKVELSPPTDQISKPSDE